MKNGHCRRSLFSICRQLLVEASTFLRRVQREKLAVTASATFIEQNVDAVECTPLSVSPVHGPSLPDKGISARYVILSIPLPATIMSRDEIASGDATSLRSNFSGAFVDL